MNRDRVIYITMRHLFIVLLLLPSLAWGTFINKSSIVSGLGGSNSAWIDYNQDGYTDIYDGGTLWRNNNGTGFTALGGYGWGIWGDYNNDGFPDIFDLNGGNVVRNNGGSGSFTWVSVPSLPGNDNRGAVWADLDGDAFIDLYIGAYETSGYEPDSVLMNNQGTSFSHTWTEPTTDGTRFPGRGVTACDFDEDGDMDVYVSNYRLEANYLWQNNGSGGLTDVAQSYGVAGVYDGWRWSYGHSIGSCWGDMNNDGHIDLFAGNFSHPDAWQDRARFYENNGPSGSWHFTQRWVLDGGAWQESYASPSLADYDNDGDLDLYYSTVYGGDNARLWRNNGNWSFTDVTGAQGLGGMPPTYQSAWGDYNNDGFLDLVSGGRLYQNQPNGNHWLKVRLEGNGTTVNRSAIGAQARINLGGGTILVRQVEAGTGEGNQNDLVLHFGLGSRTAPVTLDIRWPDGTTKVVSNVAVDQMVDQNQTPPAFDLTWGASAGIFFPAPAKGILSHLGDRALAQLYLAPDGQIDTDILPGGAPSGDDLFLDSVILENSVSQGTPFAEFSKHHDGEFQEGTLYGVIFSSTTPAAGERYYRGPGLAVTEGAGAPDTYELNTDPPDKDTWNGTVSTGASSMSVLWLATTGFFNEFGNPILPFAGNRTLAQLVYSPDEVADGILPSGVPAGDDVVLTAVIVSNNGTVWEAKGGFYNEYMGPLQSGFLYGVIYEDIDPQATDRYYAGPLIATASSIFYDLNTDPIAGNTWNGTIAGQSAMQVGWLATAGFTDAQGNPILPNIGDEAKIQLIYSPDGVPDTILPGGEPGDNDVVIDYGIVRNYAGGAWESKGGFFTDSTGSLQPGFVYGVIYENADPQANDKCYVGPLLATSAALFYDLNTDFVNGNAWNGTITPTRISLNWGASIGFVDASGNPILPNQGDNTIVLLMLAPDGVADPMMAGGVPGDDDIILQVEFVANSGGSLEKYGAFGPMYYAGGFADGYLYGVICESAGLQQGDRYYAGPLQAALENSGTGGPDHYELNRNMVDGNTWNRTIAGSQTVNFMWRASFGATDLLGNPVLPYIGDETMAQLIYCPDEVLDPILPGGIPGGNDIVIGQTRSRNDSGPAEEYGFFEPVQYQGPYQAESVYGVIYENTNPQENDRYLAGLLTGMTGLTLYDINQVSVFWNGTVVSGALADDLDQDGLPNDFETIYFGDATQGIPGQDTDLDGLSNEKEYMAGTDPTDGNSFFGVSDISQTQNDIVILLRDTSLLRGYVVEFSDDVTGSTWTPVAPAGAGTGGDAPVTDSGGAAAPVRVYRANALMPGGGSP